MSDHDSTRRTFLNQALGAGCVLALPLIVSACGEGGNPAVTESYDASESDDGTSSDSQAPETGASDSGSESAGQAPADSQPVKISKADAAYRDNPNGDQRCSQCAHFNAGSGTCQLVEGDIAPDGWCRLYTSA